MFETLELQYLHKLPEGEVRDFTTPKPFHTVKIQGLSNQIKLPTEVCSKFPLPIFALIANFTVEPSQFSDSTPPVVRPFDFPRYRFIEFAKFGQGVFQKLRVLYFLTRASVSNKRLSYRI